MTPTVALPDGDGVHLAERLVVAPAAGVFRPHAPSVVTAEGEIVEAGTRHRARRGPRPGRAGHQLLLRLPDGGARRDRRAGAARPADRLAARHRRRGRMTDLATDHRTEADDARPPSRDRTRPAPAVAVRFLGIGTALPATRLTNDDLAQRLDTSDTWIRERTGIRSRRIAGDGDTTARWRPTPAAGRSTTPGSPPATSTSSSWPPPPPTRRARRPRRDVAEALGTRGAAFDLDAACSGLRLRPPRRRAPGGRPRRRAACW